MRTVRCSGRRGGGGVCLGRECLPRGVSAQGGVCWGCTPPGPRGRHPLPMWTEFLTHACENITFPQLLLRTVKSEPQLDKKPLMNI